LSFDVNTGSGGLVTVQGDIPTGRTVASLIYDPVENRGILFGGYNANSGYLAELMELDFTISPPTWSTLAADGTPPAARGYFPAVYDPFSHAMWLHGGLNAVGTYYNDVFKLELEKGAETWREITVAAGDLSVTDGLIAHSAVYDTYWRRVVILGGMNKGGTVQSAAYGFFTEDPVPKADMYREQLKSLIPPGRLFDDS